MVHAPFLPEQPKCSPTNRYCCSWASDIPDGEGKLRVEREVAVAYRECDPFVPSGEHASGHPILRRGLG